MRTIWFLLGWSLAWAGCNQPKPAAPITPPPPERTAPLVLHYHQDGIIRGDTTQKTLALLFSGDQYDDGLEVIRKTLDQYDVKGSFFFTGRFYRDVAHADVVEKLRQKGHYLGAHSDQHLRYVSSEKPDSLLVSQTEFATDVSNNYVEMAAHGITKNQARLFMPAYEQYNAELAAWTKKLGLHLMGFTPGTRSNADYTTPEMPNYLGSVDILAHIKAYEREDPAGLNGFLLLMHIGASPARTDKFYTHLGELITWLQKSGYTILPVDALLMPTSIPKPVPANDPKTTEPAAPPKPDEATGKPEDYCPICQKLHQGS